MFEPSYLKVDAATQITCKPNQIGVLQRGCSPKASMLITKSNQINPRPNEMEAACQDMMQRLLGLLSKHPTPNLKPKTLPNPKLKVPHPEQACRKW
jgi:hypothetical protein